jgi:hypothetical protein
LFYKKEKNMTEQEEIDHLRRGFLRLNVQNRHYLKDLTQQLLYVQYPPVNPSFDKKRVEKRQSEIDELVPKLIDKAQ